MVNVVRKYCERHNMYQADDDSAKNAEALRQFLAEEGEE